MVGKRTSATPNPKAVMAWAAVAVLLALGLVTTLLDFTQLSQSEIAKANADRQRFVVNAASGEVSLNPSDSDPAAGFDVAKKEEGTAPTGEPQEPTAQAPAAAQAAQPAEEEPAVQAPVSAESAAPAAEPNAAQNTAGTETPAETFAADQIAPAAPAAPSAQPPAAPDSEQSAAPASETPAVAAVKKPVPAAPAAVPLPKGTSDLRTTPLIAKLEEKTPHTKDSLVPAPAREVSEEVDGLTLPKRGDKGVIPSSLYSRSFARKDDQVRLSFVVMNVGVDPQSIGLAMALPPEISIAYSPYTRPADAYSENLRAMGHEVWTMLPVMGERYPADDPGPLGLISKMPAEEMVRRLNQVLARIPGSVGLILPPDETIANQKDALATVLDEAGKRGLYMFATKPERTIAQITSNADFAANMRRADLVLDPTANDALIESKLAGILDAAKEKGEYVVVLSARPQSMQLLAEWLQKTTLPEDFALAPLSSLYQSAEAAPAAAAEGGGHGGGSEKKEKPPAKKAKVLPQDKYKQPAEGEKKSGH